MPDEPTPQEVDQVASALGGEQGPKTLEEFMQEGLAAEKGLGPEDFDPDQLNRGVEVELEHTKSRDIATKIAMDHLAEFPNYYDALEKMEKELKAQK
jgi:hypothetical protein